jgi:hypothetical protein
LLGIVVALTYRVSRETGTNQAPQPVLHRTATLGDGRRRRLTFSA